MHLATLARAASTHSQSTRECRPSTAAFILAWFDFVFGIFRCHLQRGGEPWDVLAHRGGAGARRTCLLEKQRQVSDVARKLVPTNAGASSH